MSGTSIEVVLKRRARLSDQPARDAALLRAPDRVAADAVRRDVAAIMATVRRRGDEGVRELTLALDGVSLDALEVPRAAWEAAPAALDPALLGAMQRTVRNLRLAHEADRPRAHEVEIESGVTVGRRPDPLGRVGVYAPGGRAAYPSSVLMGVVPARVAGVAEILVCSPPGLDGMPARVVLAAAALAGADRVFAIGGAQAIAALAMGTESVPRVDRVVGPGNAWVAEAKLQVVNDVGIDAPAGPSELLVIADDSAPAALVAREMVAQAEHDPGARVVAIVIGAVAEGALEPALGAAVRAAARREVVERSLATGGAVFRAESVDDAIAFANAYAAEHVLLALRDADRVLAALRNAGAVFVGASSSVAFGDYMTGANHVLPTGGLARAYSGLSTSDFVRWTSWQRVTPAAAAALAHDVAVFATAEGLPGHASAALAWGAPAW